MNLDIEKKDDNARIIPHGSINVANAEKLKDKFFELTRSDIYNIVMDMEYVDDIDSSALGKILLFQKVVEENDGKLIIENVESDDVKKVFNTVELSEAIDIRD